MRDMERLQYPAIADIDKLEARGAGRRGEIDEADNVATGNGRCVGIESCHCARKQGRLIAESDRSKAAPRDQSCSMPNPRPDL